jgi:hypothetical protein
MAREQEFVRLPYALINVRLGCAISPVRFGGHHLDQLMMAGDQSGEVAGGGGGQWSGLRLGKMRQHFHTHLVNLRLARANRLPVFEPISRGTLSGSWRSTRCAFTSPSVRLKGKMPEAQNDWLRAGKRAMCVSIY